VQQDYGRSPITYAHLGISVLLLLFNLGKGSKTSVGEGGLDWLMNDIQPKQNINTSHIKI
jgi:hypothetical protein